MPTRRTFMVSASATAAVRPGAVLAGTAPFKYV
jgi:hypothetical protein